MKQVANTLTAVLDHPDIKLLLDPSSDLLALAERLEGNYLFDLLSRKPSLVDQEQGITDLDLATLLDTLAQRHAMIIIEDYRSLRVGTAAGVPTTTAQLGSRRTGQINYLSGNQDCWSFSVNVRHDNDEVRNYSITGVRGELYQGWGQLRLDLNATENDFLADRGMQLGQLKFQHFVHPNRWVAFYGLPYLTLKLLIQQIGNELSYLRPLLKDYKQPTIYNKAESTTDKPATKKVDVYTLEAEVDFPLPTPNYAIFYPQLENSKSLPTHLLDQYLARERQLAAILTRLRFRARVTEFAFMHHGHDVDGGARFPAWIRNAQWEKDYRPNPRSPKRWNRLVLVQPKVGELGIALRYRGYTRKETVKDDSRAASNLSGTVTK